MGQCAVGRVKTGAALEAAEKLAIDALGQATLAIKDRRILTGSEQQGEKTIRGS